MTSHKDKQWLKEYEEFMNLDATPVPQELTKSVFSKMQALLNPSAWTIFAKILGIHLIIGTLSLSICHQFGVNPFQTQSSIADWLMKVGGHGFCMVGCGIIFLSLSFMTAGYFLSIEEVRVLRKTEFLQVTALGLFSLGLFVALGAQLALTIAGLWLVGGILGGFVTTEVAWHLKKVATK